MHLYISIYIYILYTTRYISVYPSAPHRYRSFQVRVVSKAEYLCVCVYIYIYISIYIYVYIMYLYISVYIYLSLQLYIYMYTLVPPTGIFLYRCALSLSRGPQTASWPRGRWSSRRWSRWCRAGT